MTTAQTVLAMARFGLGPRQGDLDHAGDPRDALLAELDAPMVGLPAGADLADSATLYADIRAFQMARRNRRAVAAGAVPTPSPSAASAAVDDQPSPQQIVLAETGLRARAASAARMGFVERLVAFWSNHFAVETGANPLVRGLAGAFEREAIRPHVLGRFSDMALAATQHPAMLIYLNNAVSVGPHSRLGERRAKGLNENHARELMELHTIGVDGGYTQADVTAFANVLTGWSIGARPQQAQSYGRFLFRAPAHEPGPQTVLGTRYPQQGEAQGRAVLESLAAAPATATHLATKLAVHFVADAPDPALVERLAQVFLASGGDLKALAVALVTDDTAWSAPAAKLRTPQEFIWSAMRALDIALPPRRILAMLGDLGQPLWDPPSPAGYKDDLATWLAPDAMTNRLDAAELLAAAARGPDDPRDFAQAIVGDAISADTATAIQRAESRSQGLTLLLMSPEFQRR